MRKNPYGRILKGESKEQHISIVLKSYSITKVWSYVIFLLLNAMMEPLNVSKKK